MAKTMSDFNLEMDSYLEARKLLFEQLTETGIELGLISRDEIQR
jgi:hypothetical protein